MPSNFDNNRHISTQCRLYFCRLDFQIQNLTSWNDARALKLLSAGCLCALAALALASCSASSNAKDVKPAAESPGSIIVAVAKVGAADLTRDIVLTGEFRPYQVIEVHAKVAGYLKRINIDVGDRVQAGQILATLEVPEMKDDLAHAAATHKRRASDVH